MSRFRSIPFARLLLLLVLGLGIVENAASAEGVATSSCKIFVRLISSHKAKSPGTEARKVSASLADVEAQLAPLPFDNYETIDASTSEVAFSEQGVFRLSQASKGIHTVKVRPHEVSGGRVQLTVDWEDPQGETLVSTMLRVMDGQNVMLGAEGTKKSCALVGVRAQCRTGK